MSKCFDKLDHTLIIKSIKRRVRDGSVLNLIAQFLQSGVMVDGHWQQTETGSPQGGVISPLIANIYLDAFDKEMKQRGHRIVRYADDILILCCSRAAAENAKAQATQILEGKLKLSVNTEKTHITHSDDGVKFLGVEIRTKRTRIQPKKLTAFKAKLKQMTKRNGGMPLQSVINALNPLLRGFSYYFKIANASRVFKQLASWLRRRLRSIQLKLWKKASRLHRWLRQHGYKGKFAHINMTSWSSARSPLASYAMPNSWFDELGLMNLENVATGYVFSNYAK